MNGRFDASHGYMNSVRLEAGGVVKCYQGPIAQSRWEREVGALRMIAGLRFAPRLKVIDAVAPSITMEVIDGANAAGIIDEAPEWELRHLFRACGEVRREIEAHGVIHGDFGLQNVLVQGSRIHVVDWEWCGVYSDREFDAYWFDFVVRYHYPEVVSMLPLFWNATKAIPVLSRWRDLVGEACAYRASLCETGGTAKNSWGAKIAWLASIRDEDR